MSTYLCCEDEKQSKCFFIKRNNEFDIIINRFNKYRGIPIFVIKNKIKDI